MSNNNDWGRSERVRGGTQVQLMRLGSTRVAMVLDLASREDADVFIDRALRGLKSGEFQLRLRGQVISVEEG